MQLNHYNTKFNKQNFPITIVCDNVTNAPNIGSLLRIADAFNIEQIFFCGENIPLGKRVKKTSRATEKYVAHTVGEDITKVIEDLKSKDYQIIALEITDSSTALNTLKITKDTPIGLVIGDENFGISDYILSLADEVVHITMFGENTSMNVVQAASITLYELTNQLQS